MQKSKPQTGIEANGYYFELLGAQEPQNKNRLLFLKWLLDQPAGRVVLCWGGQQQQQQQTGLQPLHK